MAYYLQVLEQNALVFAGPIEEPLEVGRRQADTEELYALHPTDEGLRLAVAALEETRVGRRQLSIQPGAEGTLRIRNLSSNVSVEIDGILRLEPSAEQTVTPPVSILLPAGRSLVMSRTSSSEPLRSLAEPTSAPGHAVEALSAFASQRSLVRTTSETEHLVQVLGATMDIFQSAQTPQDLFSSAIRGARDLGGFERALVLLWNQGQWTSVGRDQETESPRPASQTVLRHMLEQKRTFWNCSPGDPDLESASLAEVDSVIAAPILDSKGDVLGALYADRRQRPGASRRNITRLDARLTELLACGIASGLARMEQETTARKLRLQFEQFFTPELARELEAHPDLLEGRDADVSLLFCDIRGFSRISERVGAKMTFEWINDVMGVLSECVTRNQGVLVDYIGDELMAMWGAPQPQDDHARLACQAALEMLRCLPELNLRWHSAIGEAMDLGIGINSGPVRAGNAGSRRKFKYSPLGNAVNLASRVQGATKHLKARLIITGNTGDQLDNNVLRRKLASVQVVNIREPIPLYELSPPDENSDKRLYENYEKALEAFEGNDFRQAARALAEILGEWPEDGPSLVLLKRTVTALVDGPETGHPVWTLTGK